MNIVYQYEEQRGNYASEEDNNEAKKLFFFLQEKQDNTEDLENEHNKHPLWAGAYKSCGWAQK